MTMQPRISTNTNLTAFSRSGKRTMDQLIPLYAEGGYTALDLNFCEMMNPVSALNGPDAWGYIRRLRALRDAHGLEYIQAHAPYPRGYAAMDAEGRKASDEAVLRSMEYAAALGIPHIVVHPIRGTVQDNAAYFTSLLERQKTPIVIAIENMETRGEIWDADTLMEITERLSPMAGICLDTGHAHIAGADIPGFIRTAGSRLIGLHAADNNGEEDQHLLPGFGTIDWERVMEALKESYGGYLNYECMFFSRHLPRSLSGDIISLSLSIGRWLLSL